MKSDIEVLKEYENRIVDLSRRNRLLKYPKSARSIDFDLTFEDFQNRFGTPDNLHIEFSHKEILNPVDELDLEKTKVVERAYIPPTKPEGEKLINALNTLRLDTKRKFEEHGLYTLFLAIGKVKWSEKLAGRGSSDAVKELDYNAPILLIPVQIEEKKIPKKTVITTNGEYDITANKVLSLLLQKEYGSRAIDLKPRESEEPMDLKAIMEDLLLQIKERFEEQKMPYEISNEIQIGQYLFYGQQIYEDLNKNEQKVLATDFIEALCTHTPIKQESLEMKFDNPDILLNADNDFNVLDADTSQLRVIQSALEGNHLNVQGPPGTGKSQTIVNLISNLLARGKKVLVVCEKQVALEVVLDRLQSVGLDKLCLPLFHYNADKKLFAKKVIEDRDNVARYATRPNNLDRILLDREKKIQKLRAYAEAIGTVPEQLGKSVYWVHGELARNQELSEGEASIPWRGKDPLSLSGEEYQSLISLFDNIANVYNVTSDEAYAHWRNLKRQHFTPDFASRLAQVLGKTKDLISEFQAKPVQYFSLQSIKDIKKFLSLSSLADSVNSLELPVDSKANLQKAVILLESILLKVEAYQQDNVLLQKQYRIPLQWPSHKSLTTSYIKDDALLQNIENMAAQYANAQGHFEVIERCLEKLPNKEYLATTPWKEILNAKPILLLSPLINTLQDWDRLATLQSMSEQLKNLNFLFDRLNQAKSVFDTWALIASGLRENEALQIAERFDQEYRHFWRFLYSQYKHDRKIVAGWCNMQQPRKHSEYASVVTAVKDWFVSKERFELLFKNFVDEHAHRGVPFEPTLIPLLRQNITTVIEWLSGDAQVPENLAKIVFDNKERQIMVEFIASLELIDETATVYRDLFITPINGDKHSVREFVRVISSLRAEMKTCLTAYYDVAALLDVSQYPLSVSDLKTDLVSVEKLAGHVKNLYDLNLKLIFVGDDLITEVINHRERFVDLLANLKNIVVIASGLPYSEAEISIGRGLEIVEQWKIDAPVAQAWFHRYEKLLSELHTLFENELTLQDIENLSLDDFKKKLSFMITDQEGLERWMYYQHYAAQITSLGQAWFLEDTNEKIVTHPASLFAISLWNAWLDHYYATQPALKNFTIKEHGKLIKDFQTLEGEVLKVNAQRILHAVSPDIKYAKQYGGTQDRELVHQSQLKMRHKAIRKMVATCDEQLIKYKPCWMMSPLTLSSYIPYGSVIFDVVIFDEASQMRVEHALGAIARAKQVVIFGDENQLPPTSFFEISSDGDDDNDGEEGYESILNATKEILPGADEILNYHYRSKYEDLIAFSNCHIYNRSLITFPNPNHQQGPVAFEYVQNGVFDGGAKGTRRNEEEAKRVAEMCIREATESPTKSLGVIAFSKSQEVAIRDALATALKDKPQLQTKLDENSDKPEPFFVKNLESVQGDERDIIVLSVGYGPDKLGNIYNRFGPLNSQNGYRRLNVAVTRAKEKIICVSSLKATDIHPLESNRGGFLLQKYLEFAEKGMEVLVASKIVDDNENVSADSPFELEVQEELEERGYIVRRQIGASGFKIDLAIVNPKNHNEYVLGVECDGASYHSSYSARMNDRIRQEILERLGWKIYRVWSQHWLTHKNEIVEDIIRLVGVTR
jgi:superfamily I DNA and/or RNA helicase/very-short-patch-repair endonuclease